MRYKSIELINYAGIYNGMGINQISIDFTKCISNKIIIRGSNGSGKSTLINAINPNPDSNDCFIPNAEARKNICLTNNGVDYIIRYIHPVTNSGRGTTKGYISKTINGQMVELNPNGNISSCKDILYEEFNLDSNFISLSKLSSEDRGLVDNKPAERKKLVNSIISVLDTYNGIYKNLSKKSSTFKQLINSLTYKIDSLGNELQLTSRLQNIENRLNTLEDERVSTIEAIAAVKLRINEYMNILRDNNYDAVVSELKDISSHNKVLRAQILKKIQDFGITDINSIESFYSYLEKQIIITKSEIESLSRESTTLLSQREVEYNDLQNKRARLDSLQSEYNYFDLKNSIKSSKAIIEKYDVIFNQMGLMNIDLITKSEYDSAMEALMYLKDLAVNMPTLWSIDNIRYVIYNESDVINCVTSILTLKSKLDKLRMLKTSIDTEIAVFESKQDLINELSNRPKGCIIDDCPYIKSAVEASNQYSKERLSKLLEASSNAKEKIDELNNDIKLYEEYNEILNALFNIRRELDSKIKFITKLPVRPDFKESFLTRIIELDSFSDIDALYNYVDCGNMIEEYKVAKEQLSRYESEYKIYEAKNDIIESIAKDVEQLVEKTTILANQIDDNNSKISELQIKLNDLINAKTKVEGLIVKLKDDLKPSEDREAELINIKNSLDINSTEINKLHGELETLNMNLAAVNNDIKNLTNERDTIRHSLILLDEYKTELQEYSTKYNKIEKIKYYSSPSTGIQTLFMQLYMNKIISTANELLSLLFNGEFVLQPFIINENEFRIPCMGSGLLHDDISSMSTAQKCMISMILSFSILNQSSTKYNVIMLDEIDAGLDTMNRGFFIDLLDRLMLMLNAEQCFMISHNNELNTAICDLILLKNNSNDAYQGNIIWQY